MGLQFATLYRSYVPAPDYSILVFLQNADVRNRERESSVAYALRWRSHQVIETTEVPAHTPEDGLVRYMSGAVQDGRLGQSVGLRFETYVSHLVPRNVAQIGN